MLKETSLHYTFWKKMLTLIFVPAGMRLPAFCEVIRKTLVQT
jgi:hypothetical protein